MSQFFAMIACRLFGRSCSVSRPASRDLVHEMREQTRRGEAQLVQLRKYREDPNRTSRDFADVMAIPPVWRKHEGGD